MEREHPSVRGSSDWDRVREVGLREFLNDCERELIMTALEESHGSQRRAAEALHVLPTSLCERMKRLGIRRKTTFAIEGKEAPPHPAPEPGRGD